MRRILVSPAVIMLVVANPCFADTFDGSNPFTCASLQLASCGVGAACRSETPQSLNAPRFLHVSVADKTIVGKWPDESEKVTPIQFVGHQDGQMFLGGIDGPLSWHLSVAEQTGQMTLMAARANEQDQFAIVALGVCTQG